MKNKIYTISFILIFIFISGCDDLNRAMLDSPSDVTFYSNETELLMALNACYREMVPQGRSGRIYVSLDNITDIGFQREATPDKAITNGNIDSQNTYIGNAWRDMYRTISKTNQLLHNMDRAVDNVTPELYERIAAEARFIRSLNYFILTQLFGDVPLIINLLSDDEYKEVTRTPKDEIVTFILEELNEIHEILPLSYSNEDRGRVTSGAALALKARVALYNELYEEARDTANLIIQNGVYALHPSYRELFMYGGQDSQEIILAYQYLNGVNSNNLPRNIQTRMSSPNGWSIFTPSQDLIDSYEVIDGKLITESPMYDPANPFANRDPRLEQSIILPRVGSATETIMPGTMWQGYEFKTGREIPGEEYYMVDGNRVANQDVVNEYASFTGYNWLKYLDPIDSNRNPDQSDLNFILFRYAEVLLIYAEAKIELNEIDQSVRDALNEIRARAYNTDITDVDHYPAITTNDQTELRRVLRRERKVELALEGFRYDDIRRWRIAEKAMDGVKYGRPKNYTTLTTTPNIDEDGLMDYSEIAEELRYIETNSFDGNVHYLWPIPQREIDLNPNLQQNTGY